MSGFIEIPTENSFKAIFRMSSKAVIVVAQGWKVPQGCRLFCLNKTPNLRLSCFTQWTIRTVISEFIDRPGQAFPFSYTFLYMLLVVGCWREKHKNGPTEFC